MVKVSQLLLLAAGCAVSTGIAPGCYPTELLPEQPFVSPAIDEDGVISSNPLGLLGQWYVYGDAYGENSSCADVGMHERADCSSVVYPPAHVPELGFPNRGGKMCVSGVAARVLPCCTEESEGNDESFSCSGANEINCFTAGDLDHSSIWGAGIGFDFSFDPAENGRRDHESLRSRAPWDALSMGVIGVSFELEWHAETAEVPLRVEFPLQIEESIRLPDDQGTLRLDEDGNVETIAPGEVLPAEFSTEEHPYGSPFWQRAGANDWEPSPVVPGKNVVLWENVYAPPEPRDNYMKGAEPVSGDNLLGIQFHVIPDSQGEESVPFSFCISDLRFLVR